ncbi:MAG: hypothetical protein QGH73_16240 [Rhodospirillales bacterium]|jgi:hypothetical protein|nr:hypothetical protein [Rhodospirillaceae bacterium]MDP6427044.1 hypothetical protein [Rhodospirillales bacterium]MDP6645069.1 hypothetical protein [Rhodospirillales bacterium]MDP6843220.1 hypothetical protein [Rhodospirillales bacterium]|tara:strand:+ start:2024 stop:2413 length:390 start_codon:yes stop_codon:yes gene_type:complete
MNWFLIASGLAAAFMLAGHSTIGRRQFFLPMLGVSFDPTAKRVMEFVWHMSTAALVLPPFVLLYAGFVGAGEQALRYVVAYLALQFAAWGAVHLLVVSTSGLPGAVYKLFQWSLFLVVGGLAWAGIATA